MSVTNFLALCAAGAYNDTPFHRLIPSFMIQGGDISLGPAASSTSATTRRPMLPFDDIPKGGTSIYHPAALNQESTSRHFATTREASCPWLPVPSRTEPLRACRTLPVILSTEASSSSPSRPRPIWTGKAPSSARY
ncbi:Peptidyl-prolyl cis-trans isomerase-like 3 [Rasamsonia emersonii CBS 393.64]|uniref:Peptidyl-prolyl cis-trans isomerase-like 3 n=1 Tax=Rasamsonia emersonii (strain ATCC 16479 / CBS 393.64 / IMI 116815) TaxID=1408163 RepID=A0A0F4Z0M7_RASE3|nr:Peptidyl-prolyl cis-trans isomerase-like 3 [Rasamsonia emersonii CBS 393.64]KKA24082.1 Peptidyl-prolyl cis-trans isomerase-like 3 [Rasamsonia emersonii CBS 393.64]